MKKLLPISALALAAVGLVACGNSSSSSAASSSSSTPGFSSDSTSSSESSSLPAPAPKLAASFISSSLGEGSYGESSWNGYVYQADLYDNGCYRYVQTGLAYGYNMLLSSTAIINYGTYAEGDSEDGITEYTLNAASEVFFNSYSKAGGFSIVIETPTQEYPVEMVAKTQGEKNMANSKADVIAEYGAGAKIFADESQHTFSFVDPDTDETPEPVLTPSGDVSSILKGVEAFQIVNEFAKPGAYGDGSWKGDLHIATVYDDNTYDYFNSTLNYGYSMLLSTQTIRAEGKATFGSSEDGWTKLDFAKADEVLFNANSKAGGFAIQIDTRTATYPVEMVAKTQGEKNMANSKDDVLNEYGFARTFYLSDSTGTMSIENPNE